MVRAALEADYWIGYHPGMLRFIHAIGVLLDPRDACVGGQVDATGGGEPVIGSDGIWHADVNSLF